MAIKKNNSDTHNEIKWPYGKNNYIMFAIAMVVIIAGFFMLSTGDITVAPILLVIGYLVLIPVSLMMKDSSVSENKPDSDSPEITE